TLTALEAKRTYVGERFREKTLREYIGLAMEKFDRESDAAKKQIVQTIIPRVVYHPSEKRLEMFVNPDPRALGPSGGTGCHASGGGRNLRVLSNWRGGRDSNPRPSA